MATMRDHWQRELDEMRRDLRLAEIFLREAETQDCRAQAELARQKLNSLKTKIHRHSVKLFSTVPGTSSRPSGIVTPADSSTASR